MPMDLEWHVQQLHMAEMFRCQLAMEVYVVDSGIKLIGQRQKPLTASRKKISLLYMFNNKSLPCLKLTFVSIILSLFQLCSITSPLSLGSMKT